MKKKLKVARMHILEERWILGNPIVFVDIYGKGGYKNIINMLSGARYDIITLPNYDRKIVKYANKKGIQVEDEFKFLPIYFERKFKKRFDDFGPLDLGIIFSKEDARIGEKVALKVAKYCRFLTLPNLPRSRRVGDRILNANGLQINLENSIEKIKEKCDIILDIKNLELSAGSIYKTKEEEF